MIHLKRKDNIMEESLINSEIWRKLYAQGSNDLRYPNDLFVRIINRYLDFTNDLRVCDVGMGTGANLLHVCNEFRIRDVPFFELTGIEVSSIAIDKAKSRLDTVCSNVQLVLIDPNRKLPFHDGSFDAVISWQVLYYNDETSFKKDAKDMNRILAPGGLFVCSTAAPGDLSARTSEQIDVDTFVSQVKGQEGALLYIPSLDNLQKVFQDENCLFGEFSYELDGLESRHWVVIYRKGLRLDEWNGH